MKNKKILIVGAHPDDEILGCGGTIKRLVEEGNEAYTLILGEGILARYNSKNDTKYLSEIELLKTQMINANNIIGIDKNNIFTTNLPDNKFDAVPLLDIIKIIEKIKNKVRPDIIFTHYENDLNIDHQLTFKAVLTATRPQIEESVKEIYSFEIPSSTEWRYPLSFSPNMFFDISNHIDFKIKAMEMYTNEIKNFLHPRSSHGLHLNAKNWGMKVGCECAEAFKMIRVIK